MSDASQRRVLEDAFAAAVARCQADESMQGLLPDPPADGRVLILGAGKATARMAEVAEAHYRSRFPRARVTGLVVIPDGEPAALDFVEVRRAAHPLPDERSVAAASRMLALADAAAADDHVVVLISGGASALLAAPVDGITLADKRHVTEALFAAGAPIDDLNTVRKFLSAVKGGRLARACWPAPVTTLAVSDVVGDDPGIIGSAPTVPSRVRPDDVRRVLTRHGIEPPEAVRRRLAMAPAPVDGPWPDLDYRIVARPIDALQAAATLAEDRGYRIEILGDDIQGEAGVEAARMARLCAGNGGQKLALLSGGEVTVTFQRGGQSGYGGPNREFALALAIGLEAARRVAALVADTDGIDGQSGRNGPVAGAIVDAATVARAAERGLDAQNYLAAHDSGSFFETIGDEVVTGPTRTNVNDFRMILIN